MVKGMKQTEIGVIPEDWEVVKIHNCLTDMTDFVAAGSFESLRNNVKVYDVENYALYVRLYDIRLGLGHIKQKYVDIESYKFLSKSNLFGGELLMANIGANVGDVFYMPALEKYATIAPNMIVLRIKENFDSKYLYYFIDSEYGKKLLNELISGSGHPKINKTDLKKLDIILPPLPEQEAIAGALSDAYAWIESLEQLIAKKRLIKQGAMQELLTPKEGWEVKKLEEVGEIITGGTPSTLVAEYWSGDIPWITPTDINIKKDIYFGERNLTLSGLSQIRKLRKNSLLVTCIASIGKNAILRVDGACNQQINAITPNASFSVDYLYYLLELNKNKLIGKAGTTATLMLSKAEFSLIEFLFPSLPQQTRIATILSDMDAELEALEQQLHKARQIKQGMMQELLTGRVRLVMKKFNQLM
ncbi:restriction endonuclease subunit S [Chryseobacterium sp. cx-311]|uniref:restriction endonuclease subunit S n=1 Tax=Marnyiella aurantia TaxID=2758037 RepID=UPI001AE2CCE9|nr:restriction endonuclease subunit S [Marnyiella aurantia]MBP0613678.1 restriction endonuclease subunit S [Marnyiella aurantia]